MLVQLSNNKLIGLMSISNPTKEQEFLNNNPSYIQTDFNFTEDLDLYEYDGTTFNLVADWETIKAEREALANDATLNEQGVQVPNTVTARQIRIQLSRLGVLTTLTDAINNGTDEELKIEWEYATEFKRDYPSLVTVAEANGFTAEDLDSLFIEASKL